MPFGKGSSTGFSDPTQVSKTVAGREALSLSRVCICRNMAEPCRAESTDAEVGEPVAEARTWLVIEARLKATIRRCWEDAVRLSEWEMHPEDQCSTPTLTASSTLNQLKSEQN